MTDAGGMPVYRYDYTRFNQYPQPRFMSEYNESDSLRSAWRNARAYVQLYARNLKLLSIEKTTLLLSGAALAFMLLLLVIIAFFFISIGLILVLAEVLPLMWCFIIMGGVYLVLALLAFVLRRSLFTDPIARFISRLFIDNPDGDDDSPVNVES